MLTTPVVFLIFRRPDLTAKVFEEIRRVQPPKLLVVADGPRNEEEAKLCEEARGVIETVDWSCEVYKNYSNFNLGCRQRVSSGITWAFEQVEEAIILEDDCLPNTSFFHFCQSLLDYYRDDERVWVISGNNFQDGQWRGDGSYYFSRYNHCWGWATWKRSWKYFEEDLQTWPSFRDNDFIQCIFDDPVEATYWTEIFDQLFENNEPNTWDYQWTYTCWKNSGLTILPNVNLVSNIGFGDNSTHTNDLKSPFANMPTHQISDIVHPTFLVRDKVADSYTFTHNFNDKEEIKKKWLYVWKKRLSRWKKVKNAWKRLKALF